MNSTKLFLAIFLCHCLPDCNLSQHCYDRPPQGLLDFSVNRSMEGDFIIQIQTYELGFPNIDTSVFSDGIFSAASLKVRFLPSISTDRDWMRRVDLLSKNWSPQIILSSVREDRLGYEAVGPDTTLAVNIPQSDLFLGIDTVDPTFLEEAIKQDVLVSLEVEIQVSELL